MKKAIELLHPFGILLIVTPGQRKKQRESWKLAMNHLGMLPIYSKDLEQGLNTTCWCYVKIHPKTDFNKVFESQAYRIMSLRSPNFDNFDIKSAFYIPRDLEND